MIQMQAQQNVGGIAWLAQRSPEEVGEPRG